MKIGCPYCQTFCEKDDSLAGTIIACPKCGRNFQVRKLPADHKYKPPENLRVRFNNFTGLEKLEGFSLLRLFSAIFRRHKPEEIEEIFLLGTSRATPPIAAVDTSWPRPWLFFRTLAASIVLYLLFRTMLHYFDNPLAIPGLVLMGTLAVPLSTLLFFYEVNVRRNIPLYKLLKPFCFGGVLALLVTCSMYKLMGNPEGNIGLALAGPVEETAKLLALVLVARARDYHYKLNGLLMGATIGTGFAIFESLGYAFMGSEDTVQMENVILLRGMLSPLGHIVWTAIAGAAFWRVKDAGPFHFSKFWSGQFWHLFLIPVILHSLWDIPLLDWVPYCGKYLLLGFVAWIVAIALVQEGLKELRAEKKAVLETTSIGNDLETIPSESKEKDHVTAIPVPPL